MSSDLKVHHRITKTELKGWKFTASSGDEKAKSSGYYHDSQEGWVSRVPLFGSEDPYIPSLRLVDISAEDEEGGIMKVTLSFESASGTTYPGRPEGAERIRRYSVSTSEGEEHILTHARYGENLDAAELRALMAIANGSEGKDDGSSYEDDITSELGVEVLAKIRKGTIARKAFTMSWLEKSTSENLADIEYSRIHKWYKPPGGVGGEAENWLYAPPNVNETAEGGVYEFEKRWDYSPEGWDEQMYKPSEGEEE